jgi:hypothetical protein
MCVGARGEMRGVICTIQREGYDVCPASKVGRSLLDRAYTPLLNAGLDYLQVLDQNHGGGQYLCYEEEHGHPTSPGKWMTENMQQLLKDWKARVPKALFGCESAAAEPFIPSLLFNDNRFELTLKVGRPLPLYQYFYHEYVRNFMGNQVGCPIKQSEDSLRYRIAYSFVAGDSMTIVVNPEGKIMAHWGREYYENKTDGDKVLLFIRNLTRFYKNLAKPYLYSGRMVGGDKIECEEVAFERRDKDGYLKLPKLYYSHWQSKDGKRATIVANPTENEIAFEFEGKHFAVPALDAILID